MPRRVAERLRRTFWLLPAIGLTGGVVCAYLLTLLDEVVHVDLGLFSFGDLEAARNALGTLATATLSVAGITFSVTLVALQLASSQLSPRVLTTFREDRLTQSTLGAFLGTFSYALVLLGRLRRQEEQLPELSLSIAMLLALAALALFVAFIASTVASLQASTVVRRITADGRRALASAHPNGVGANPDDPEQAAQVVDARLRAQRGHDLRARRGGFLLSVGGAIVAAARRHDALVVQQAQVGDLIVQEQVVARVHFPGAPPDGAVAEIESGFAYGEERTMAADVAFPVRALADIALRALSPSINDVTTAENAMGAVTDTIIEWLRQEPAPAIRVDADGTPRLLARFPVLDDLVVLGFEQVRLMVEHEHPLLAARLVIWLELIADRGRAAGCGTAAITRQIELLEPTAACAPG